MIDEYTVVDPLLIFYDWFWLVILMIFLLILGLAIWGMGIKYGNTQKNIMFAGYRDKEKT